VRDEWESGRQWGPCHPTQPPPPPPPRGPRGCPARAQPQHVVLRDGPPVAAGHCSTHPSPLRAARGGRGVGGEKNTEREREREQEITGAFLWSTFVRRGGFVALGQTQNACVAGQAVVHRAPVFMGPMPGYKVSPYKVQTDSLPRLNGVPRGLWVQNPHHPPHRAQKMRIRRKAILGGSPSTLRLVDEPPTPQQTTLPGLDPS